MEANPAPLGSRVLQAADRGSNLGGGVALVTPQGDAEADQSNTGGDSHRPIERLWQYRERGGGDGAQGEKGRGRGQPG